MGKPSCSASRIMLLSVSRGSLIVRVMVLIRISHWVFLLVFGASSVGQGDVVGLF
jgi:hypothetical protein